MNLFDILNEPVIQFEISSGRAVGGSITGLVYGFIRLPVGLMEKIA